MFAFKREYKPKNLFALALNGFVIRNVSLLSCLCNWEGFQAYYCAYLKGKASILFWRSLNTFKQHKWPVKVNFICVH